MQVSIHSFLSEINFQITVQVLANDLTSAEFYQ